MHHHHYHHQHHNSIDEEYFTGYHNNNRRNEEEEDEEEQDDMVGYEDDEDEDYYEDALQEQQEMQSVKMRHLSDLFVSFLMLKSRAFRRGYLFVIFVWLLLFCFGVAYGFRFLGETKAQFSAPMNSKAFQAESLFRSEFPYEASRAAATLVLIHTKKNQNQTTVLTPQVKRFDLDLVRLCKSTYHSSVIHVSYFSLQDSGLSPLAKDTLDNVENPHAMLISLTYTRQGSLVTSDSEFVDWTERTVEGLRELHLKDEYEAKVTGLLAFYRDINAGTEKDLMIIDLISFPLAMVVLAGMLKSVRLLVIPVVNIAVTVCVSFLIMWPIASYVDVVTFAPSIMGSTALALSIDFSLFLLSRYRHELVNRPRNRQRDAVRIVLASSGHTIFVSGITLACCWFGLCGFPVIFLSTMGVAAGVASLTALVVNLTLTPALLLAFPTFFTNLDEHFHGIVACMCCFRCFGLQRKPPTLIPSSPSQEQQQQQQHEIVQYHPLSNLSQPILLIPASSSSDSGRTALIAVDTLWHQFSRMLLRTKLRAFVIATLILLSSIPFSYLANDIKTSNSFLLTLPRDKNATHAYEYLNRHFGAGRMSPYHLVIIPPESVSIVSQEFFSHTSKVIQDVFLSSSKTQKNNVLHASGIQGIMFIDSEPVPFNSDNKSAFSVTYCFENANRTGAYPFKEKCNALKIITERQVARHDNPDTGKLTYSSTYVQICLSIEPESQQGAHWVDKVRLALAAEQAKDEGYEYYLAGGDIVMKDIVDSVYDAFPFSIGVTMIIVFIFIAVAFRSIAVPIRSLITIAVTMAIIWGLSALVYRYGVLDFLNLAPFMSTYNGEISWLAPVVSFSVAVGLSLDYDCYLLTKIIECQVTNRLSESNAVIMGLAESGSVITAAGAIMVVAWSGLLLSSQPVLNQIGFYLVCAVLIDCLVVRTVLVPCVMYLLGKFQLNWYPRGYWKRYFQGCSSCRY